MTEMSHSLSRHRMVEEIAENTIACQAETGRARLAWNVIGTLADVPRHEFVLAGLAGHVYSVEIIAELEAPASERLARLGFVNVETRCADGNLG